MIWNPKQETLSRDDLAQVQIERLQSTLNRARRNVAYYRQAFAGVTIEEVRTTADLARLPFTTKDDLRSAYPYGMFAVPFRDIVRIQCSSGTTGRPVVVGYTQNDLRAWSECVARVLAAGGVTEHDIVLVAFAYGLFTGGLGFHYGAERIGAAVVPASTGPLERQIMILRDFNVSAIACTPGYALAIADTLAVAGSGAGPEALALRTGFFGAEPWSEPLREQLERRLGIRAYDNYGLTEVLGPGVSFECEHRRGLHINEDHFIAEIVDPATGAVRRPGEVGELVLTTIAKEGFPLVRFRTGDLTAIDASPCPCSRTFVRMARIRGRIDDMINLGAVKVFPSQVEEVLAATPGVTPHYEIIVDRAEGEDTLEVKVEIAEDVPGVDEVKTLERLKEQIARKLHAVLAVAARVSLVEPRSLARGGGAKARRVIDRRER